MAKQILKILDDLSPSEIKLRDLPRKPDGLHNMHLNEYGQLVKRAGYAQYNTDVIGASSTLTGTVAINKSSTAVVGTNTLFTTELAVGDLIKIIEEIFTVSVITDNTNLTLDSAYQGADASGVTAYQLHKIVGMHRYYKKDLTKKFLVAWKEDIYYLDETSPYAAHSIKSGLTANSDTYFADFDDVCYMLNGVNGVFKYNVTRFGTVGVTVPAAPTVSLTGSGSSLGEGKYKFCYTYIDDDGYESNPSDVSNEVTITATKEKVTIPLSGTTYRKNVYRTSVNGAIYYKDNIGGVLAKVTVTYESTRADNTLGNEVKYNHNAPQATSHLITKRRNKLYLAYQDYLYPSHTTYIEYFPPLWRQRTGNSQNITGILEQLITLSAFTEDSVERLVGTDEDNIEFKNSFSTEGNIAIRSLVNCDNLLVYLGFNGINYFDGVNSGIFSEAINEYIKANINNSVRHLSCATYWDNKYWLCYPKGANALPSETIWYDLKNKKYGIYDFAFSCFSRWDRGTDGLRLFGGSNTIGRVYEIAKSTILTDYNETTEADDAITAYDSPEPIDLGLPEFYKQWYSILIKIKTTSGTALAMFYTLDNGTETSAKMVSRDDITFVDGGVGVADTITTEEGDFVAAGFKAEDVLVVTGTDSNNGNMTIVSVVDKTITLGTGVVTAEAEGAAILTKAKILTANTTKWYRIGLGSGGTRARSLKPRPYMSDKFNFEIHGYMICFELEPFAEEKE